MSEQCTLRLDYAPMPVDPGHYWLQCQHSGEMGIGRWNGHHWHMVGTPQAASMASVLSLFLLGPRIPEPHPSAVVIASLA